MSYKNQLPVGTIIIHHAKKDTRIEIKNVSKFNIVNQEPFTAKVVCYNRFFLVKNGVKLYTKL